MTNATMQVSSVMIPHLCVGKTKREFMYDI